MKKKGSEGRYLASLASCKGGSRRLLTLIGDRRKSEREEATGKGSRCPSSPQEKKRKGGVQYIKPRCREKEEGVSKKRKKGSKPGLGPVQFGDMEEKKKGELFATPGRGGRKKGKRIKKTETSRRAILQVRDRRRAV